MNNNPLEIAQLHRARAEQTEVAEAKEARKAIRPSDRAIGCMTFWEWVASLGSSAFTEWLERRTTEWSLAREEKKAAIGKTAHLALVGVKDDLARAGKIKEAKLIQLGKLKKKQNKMREHLGRLDAQLFKRSKLTGARAEVKGRTKRADK